MSPIGMTGLAPLPGPEPSRTAGKARDAAQQFEALLIGQMLQAARESHSSESADSITDFAEQQLATVMSRSGGLGIADQIARSLEPPAKPPSSHHP